MNYSYYTSYSVPSPSPDPLQRSSPSPPPSTGYHLPLPVPSSFSHGSFSRSNFPTSCPDNPRYLPAVPPTASFTSGYASPAASSYSSEPASRDELEMMEPALGGSNFPHVTLPGVDGIMAEGMHLDNPRNDTLRDREYRRGWNMTDFVLVQTVGTTSRFFPNVLLGTGTFGRVFLARFASPTPSRPEFFALKVNPLYPF
jgi:hypothetical protein